MRSYDEPIYSSVPSVDIAPRRRASLLEYRFDGRRTFQMMMMEDYIYKQRLREIDALLDVDVMIVDRLSYVT